MYFFFILIESSKEFDTDNPYIQGLEATHMRTCAVAAAPRLYLGNNFSCPHWLSSGQFSQSNMT